jgi:hypothetical protein
MRKTNDRDARQLDLAASTEEAFHGKGATGSDARAMALAEARAGSPSTWVHSYHSY